MLTPEELNQALSDNFDGNDNQVEILENYNGKEDRSIEFFDGSDFKSLEKSSKRFSFKVDNSSENDIVLVLTPGYFRVDRPQIVYATVYDVHTGLPTVVKKRLADNTEVAAILTDLGKAETKYDSYADILAAGIQVDAVLDDGEVIHKVICQSTTKERSIRNFLEYISKNPTLFAGIQISSDNTDQYESTIVFRRTTPYAIYGEEVFHFQDAFRTDNLNEKKIVIAKEFQFDGETITTVRIPATTVTTFTLIASAVITPANMLVQKKEDARKGIVKKVVKMMKKR